MTDNSSTFTPAKDDAAILAAWERRAAAYATYETLSEHTGDGPYSPEEQAQWDIIDMAELLIASVAAKTPRGVEIQIWCSLYHDMTKREECEAARQGNLDWFHTHMDDMEWTNKLLLMAIHSLREQGK